MEKTGYIYVLTNESFHRENWVKIGYAEDVDKRVKELSNTSVPLPYQVYCTYEIPRIKGVKDPDKLLHGLITKLNPNLRISPNREFFEMLPWDAYEMLLAIAQMHNRTDKLKRNEKNLVGQDTQIDSEYTVDALFPPKTDIRRLYDKLKRIVLPLDSSLSETPTRLYVTFKKNKKCNAVSFWPKDGWIEIVLNAKIGQLTDSDGLLTDITNRKWSASQYAIKYFDDTNIEAVEKLIKQTINLKNQ